MGARELGRQDRLARAGHPHQSETSLMAQQPGSAFNQIRSGDPMWRRRWNVLEGAKVFDDLVLDLDLAQTGPPHRDPVGRASGSGLPGQLEQWDEQGGHRRDIREAFVIFEASDVGLGIPDALGQLALGQTRLAARVLQELPKRLGRDSDRHGGRLIPRD